MSIPTDVEPESQEQLQKRLRSIEQKDSLLSLEASEEEQCRPESDRLYSGNGSICDAFGNTILRIGEQV